jgi:FKBP-type peptidyl-prolyl cis-trans isomerase SlpA
MPSQRVQANSFLTLHYRLAGPDGADLVNTFGGKQPATLSLGCGVLAPPIEARLVGLEEGAHARFELAPGVAFGERSEALVQRVSLRLLAELSDEVDYAVGDVVRFPTPDGRSSYAGVVREAGEDWLLFDFNHPLAGQPVSFEVHLIGVL